MAIKKIRIALDCDGCIVDLLPQWLSMYNQETNENLQVSDIKEWDLFSQVKQPKILNKILLSKGFFQKPEPYLDVLEVLPKLLKDERFDIFIATQVPRSSPYAGWDKREWLRKWLPEFDLEKFISIHHKYLLRADVILDDHPRHLKQWLEEDGTRTAICMDHLYNKKAVHSARVYSWKGFEERMELQWNTVWNPPKSKGCNQHEDCSKKEKSSECCHDVCCTDCFGY